MNLLEIRNLKLDYKDINVLSDFQISLESGEILVILGKSGCGKTTLIKIIAGILKPNSGKIILNNEDITNLPPEIRNIGYVPQTQILFNNMTVEDNIKFGLKIKKLPILEVKKRIERICKLTQIQDKLSNYPLELSLGQQQRVFLARALILNPKILLLDEPLASIDNYSRERLSLIIRQIIYETKIPIIYVTHNYEEAQLIGDRIAIMDNGHIVQTGTYQSIQENIHSFECAKIMGTPNIWKINHDPVENSKEISEFMEIIKNLNHGNKTWYSISPQSLQILQDSGDISSIEHKSIKLIDDILRIQGILLGIQKFTNKTYIIISFSSKSFTEFIKVESFSSNKIKKYKLYAKISLEVKISDILFFD